MTSTVGVHEHICIYSFDQGRGCVVSGTGSYETCHFNFVVRLVVLNWKTVIQPLFAVGDHNVTLSNCACSSEYSGDVYRQTSVNHCRSRVILFHHLNGFLLFTEALILFPLECLHDQHCFLDFFLFCIYPH